jgi:hypothetical protein
MAQITFKLPERIVHWPKIVKKITAKDEMYATLVCKPPLGQPTIVPAGTQSVTFNVLLETDLASEKKWQVALWHDLGSSPDNWSAVDFQETSTEHDIVCSHTH